MKKSILILLIPFISLSQEFKFTPEGIQDYIVQDIEGRSQEEIYTKTKLWILDAFVSPDDAILVDLENQKIRFQFKYSTERYHVEVEFKEGKLKFDPISINNIYETYGGNIPLGASYFFFNKKGKSKYLREPAREEFENTLNNTMNSLVQYIKSDTKDEW